MQEISLPQTKTKWLLVVEQIIYLQCTHTCIKIYIRWYFWTINEVRSGKSWFDGTGTGDVETIPVWSDKEATIELAIQSAKPLAFVG